MRFALSLFVIAVLLSCSKEPPTSGLHYDPATAKTCPAPDATNRYIEVPAFYDLEAFGAKTSNVNELNPVAHASLAKAYAGKNLSIYYEIHAPIDPAKDLLMLIPGGPGGDHHMIHTYEERFPELFERFNVVAMDHRGIGCSRPVFPGNEPYQAMLMRYAASDIEVIRRELVGESGKIALIGHSYGTILAQTYALLYPDNTSHVVLQSAIGAAEDYRISRRKFEYLAVSTVPGVFEKYEQLKSDHPDLAVWFINWAKRPLYRYEGRTKQIPETFHKFYDLVYAGDIEQAKAITLPEISVLPWMTRALACVELFPYEILREDEFELFPYNFATCREFEGNFEYFDYLDDLHNVTARTLVFGGLYDPVTPIESMRKIAAAIPNAFLYQDPHLSHSMQKEECLRNMMTALFDGKSEAELEDITFSPACKKPPAVH